MRSITVISKALKMVADIVQDIVVLLNNMSDGCIQLPSLPPVGNTSSNYTPPEHQHVL